MVAYLRNQGTLAGTLLLVFAASAPIFVARLLSYFFSIDMPRPVTAAFTVALLAQPPLTLRLAALLQPVPRWLTASAWIGYLATAVPIAVVVAAPQPEVPLSLTLATVGVYVGTALCAAVYFARGAQRRIGSARMRLVIASAATLLMAGTLILAGAGAAAPGVSSLLSLAARYGVLLAATAYAAAFMTPAWLRRLWQAHTGYQMSRRILAASVKADSAATWRLFAELAAGATGVSQASVLVGDVTRGARFVATVGDLSIGPVDGPRFGALLAHAPGIVGLPIERASDELRAVTGPLPGHFMTVVMFDAVRGETGLLMLVGERRSLFSHDDRDLLASLGVEAALLAGRAEALAEQTELASRLSSTVEALHAASQAKNDFLASMSHELRTPLNAILGFSDLMRSENEVDGRRNVPSAWIDHVHVAGRRLLALINDVLDLAKVEAGRLELQLEMVDASQAAADAVDELRPLAEQKSLKLSADVESITVRADRGRLRQILYNLISNSIKFTPPGGEIRVECSVDDEYAHLSVIDTGMGIAPEDQERIFEEFTQVGDSRMRAQGTGLGLALSRRLAEAHGGHLEVQSDLGAGSRFTVMMPRSLEVSRVVLASHDGVRPLAHDRPDSRPLILVIEDDPQAVALVRGYLEPHGYRVHAATNGVDGMATARRLRPSAILLDIQLPGIDGWEVLRRLKADPDLNHIPVLIVTVVDDRDVGLALGAADYLLKPIDRTSLMAAVERHIAVGSDGRRPKVLAADDDPAALELIRAALEPEGYELVLARDGREAINVAHRGAFDLIICDLVMPDLDGFEVVAQLKAADETRDTPILILTAHTLSSADKARLKGKIVGICEKGDGSADRLLAWLGSEALLKQTTAAGQ